MNYPPSKSGLIASEPAAPNHQGRAWLALAGALAVHVADEALTGFLAVYNPAVLALREFAPAYVQVRGVAGRVAGRNRAVVAGCARGLSSPALDYALFVPVCRADDRQRTAAHCRYALSGTPAARRLFRAVVTGRGELFVLGLAPP